MPEIFIDRLSDFIVSVPKTARYIKQCTHFPILTLVANKKMPKTLLKLRLLQAAGYVDILIYNTIYHSKVILTDFFFEKYVYFIIFKM